MSTALEIVQRFYPNVTTVKDATAPLKIEVTKKDCQSRAVKNHTECALAVACKRSFKIKGVVIAVKVAYLVEDSRAIRYQLGEAISREITAFDRKGNFEPGDYTLLVPSYKIGTVSRPGSHKKSKKGKAESERSYRHVTTDVRDIWSAV